MNRLHSGTLDKEPQCHILRGIQRFPFPATWTVSSDFPPQVRSYHVIRIEKYSTNVFINADNQWLYTFFNIYDKFFLVKYLDI